MGVPFRIDSDESEPFFLPAFPPALCAATPGPFLRKEHGMSISIYVGNLPYSVSESDLVALFSSFGKVTGARIITDPGTGRSKGYAFITMHDRSEGEAAAQKLDGSEFNGRTLKVSEARRRKEREPQPERQPRRKSTAAAGRPQVRFPSDWNTWKK
jgi:RNA recognition motif-containing protein